MMRRTLIAIIMALTACLPLYSIEASKDSVSHNMVGYVYGSVSFNVSLNEAVPFDLESSTVAENPHPTTVLGGLTIGTYSLITNVDFRLYVTHDKLHLVERTFGTTYTDSNGNTVEDPGTLSEIDYRLYMATGPTGSFLSCLSDGNAYISAYASITTAFTNQILIQGNQIDLPNQNMYLTLEDHTSTTTAQTVNNLKAGTYKSNIYFYLIVET